jgi:hypothetical protein
MSDSDDELDQSTISSKSMRTGMTEEEATAVGRPGTKQPSDLWADHTTMGMCDLFGIGGTMGLCLN